MTDLPQNPSQPTSPGQVILVGAGPGDPGLITVAGLEALRRAEVVVYDALANPTLLEAVSDNCELIDAGKRAKQHRLTQDQTNARMLESAKQGKRVVRLKGGDPYLFGRGAEEVAYLARHGVSCRVIPGITSGIAAPMYAGIPVTHRKVASTLTFVTAHEDPTKPQSAVDYAALACLVAAGGTACFYMGVGRLPGLSATLIDEGLPRETPAAVVQWGTSPRQRSVRGTLSGIAKDASEAGITAPAMIVVGQVAGLDEPGLRFFEQRSLFGHTVLVTRTRRQASGLSGLLEDAGARVIEAPTIDTVPPATYDPLDEALGTLSRRDWLIVTSANAVHAIADRIEALPGLDARGLAGVRIAAVGRSTDDALFDRLRVRADFVPRASHGEGLARELIEHEPMTGKRCLLVRGDLAGPQLPDLLAQAGAVIGEVQAYQTRPIQALSAAALDSLRAGEVDWAVFASSSSIRNLIALLGSERHLLDAVRCVSIGPITSGAMRESGVRVAAEADTPSVVALAEALITQANREARHA